MRSLRGLGGQLEGDGSVVVSQVATLVSAQSGQIAFPSPIRSIANNCNPQARPLSSCHRNSLATLRYRGSSTPIHMPISARVVGLLNPPDARPCGVHPSAVVHSYRAGERQRW